MRKEKWLEAKRLRAEGLRSGAIAKRLGVSRRAVTRALTHREYPKSRGGIGRPSAIVGYRGLLLAKLELYPELSAIRLFKLLQENGYKGKYGAVKEYVRVLRPLIATGSPGEMQVSVECAHPFENDPSSEPSSDGKLEVPKAKTAEPMFVELELGSPAAFSSLTPQVAAPVSPKENVIRVVCGETLFELPPGFDGNEFKRALLALKEAS